MKESERLLAELHQHSDKGRVFIKNWAPQMYKALIEEGRSPKQAADFIREELRLAGYNESYISEIMPKEAKEPDKVKAGQASVAVRQVKQKTTTSGEGTSTIMEDSPIKTENMDTPSGPSEDILTRREPEGNQGNVAHEIFTCNCGRKWKCMEKPDGSTFHVKQ